MIETYLYSLLWVKIANGVYKPSVSKMIFTVPDMIITDNRDIPF